MNKPFTASEVRSFIEQSLAQEPPIKKMLSAFADRLEEDKRAASRYRWMRGMRNRERAADLMKYKMNLDAAIDAAMAEESGNG